MSDKREHITCGHCGGLGLIEFTGVYAETLQALRDFGGPATSAELARQVGCKATAMNNRLARLEDLGFAVSARFGRKRLYRAVEKQ